MPYRIVDWDKNFENNRTRGMKEMQWVPITNRMDGAGYTELVEGPKGAARLGCWIAIVEIASRCPVRGTLVRESGTKVRESGTLLPKDLARISRLPVDALEDAISKLLEIQWLEEIPQEGAGKLRESGTKVRESGTLLQSHKNGTEGTEGKEGKEGKEPQTAAPTRPPLPALTSQEWNEPDREQIAHQIANDLIQDHWFNSDPSLSKIYLNREISTAVDPNEFDETIRRSHRLWRDRVEQARQSGSQIPRAIEHKAFEYWVKDRLYVQPPKFGPISAEPSKAKPKPASNVVVKLPPNGQALTREQVEAIRAGASVE
jgi:hypothetical protein